MRSGSHPLPFAVGLRAFELTQFFFQVGNCIGQHQVADQAQPSDGQRNLFNRFGQIHTRTKNAGAAIAAGADDADVLVREAIAKIDKAAANRVMHKNKAAHQSQLAKRLNAGAQG